MSVSGRRKKAQRLISVAPAMNTKIDCHGPVSSSTWPTPGAMMGMAMKTMKISDMTSAMSRPAKRSRTTAVATTRVAAAPRPCVKRRARRTKRREGRGEGADDIDAQPEQQRDAAAEAVGQRPEDELREAEAEHVGADHQLPLVFV